MSIGHLPGPSWLDKDAVAAWYHFGHCSYRSAAPAPSYRRIMPSHAYPDQRCFCEHTSRLFVNKATTCILRSEISAYMSFAAKLSVMEMKKLQAAKAEDYHKAQRLKASSEPSSLPGTHAHAPPLMSQDEILAFKRDAEVKPVHTVTCVVYIGTDFSFDVRACAAQVCRQR